MLDYEKTFELRGSDFDRWNHLRPSSVLDFFQEVAARHAEQMHMGFFDLIGQKMIWVLTRVKYEIVGQVRRNEHVTVRTWPQPPRHVIYRREYTIEGEDGRRLVNGASEWVIAHSEKRSVLAPGNIYPEGEEFCTELLFDRRFRHVPPFETEEKGEIVRPSFTHLDLNGHVNNTHYASYVMDAIRPDRDTEISRFQIDYHRELLLGEPVEIQLQRQDGCILAQGVSSEGERMFACKLDMKKRDDTEI